MRRHFLLLQGGVGPLFSRLGSHLEHAGHVVSRLNFCTGDWLVWRRRGAIAFREPLGALSERLKAICSQGQVTDLVLFGGCRPIHRRALAVAQALGLRTYVLDEGYLRPNWITIERGGLHGSSPLPRDPAWYRRVAPGLPPVPVAAPADQLLGDDRAARAVRGGSYQLARLADPWAYPHYRSHRVDHPVVEAAGWLRRFSLLALRRRSDRSQIERLLSGPARFFLLPLQLRGDAQVVHHSPFSGMFELIERVIQSFAAQAPADAQLLIKNHPLDSGLQDYAAHACRLASAAGIADRVHYVESGALGPLLAAAAGLVTINSTSGLAALMQGCPTCTLGQAVYDLPGMTFQGGLERFWAFAQPPESALTTAFVRTLVHTTQLRGNPYTASGVELALRGIDRFLAEPSPLEVLLARSRRAREIADPRLVPGVERPSLAQR